jgi:hypothetical protein
VQQVHKEDKDHRQQVLEVRLEHKVPKDHKDHHHKDQQVRQVHKEDKDHRQQVLEVQ